MGETFSVTRNFLYSSKNNIIIIGNCGKDNKCTESLSKEIKCLRFMERIGTPASLTTVSVQYLRLLLGSRELLRKVSASTVKIGIFIAEMEALPSRGKKISSFSGIEVSFVSFVLCRLKKRLDDLISLASGLWWHISISKKSILG